MVVEANTWLKHPFVYLKETDAWLMMMIMVDDDDNGQRTKVCYILGLKRNQIVHIILH